MYTVIKSVIDARKYKLSDIARKINRAYYLGDITEVEANELLTFATAGASLDAERPETLTLLSALLEKISILERKVIALEGGEGGNTNTPDETTTEYPEWVPWDGLNSNYQYGAIVSHKGCLWESTHPNQNVWEPGTIGTEGLWRLYN